MLNKTPNVLLLFIGLGVARMLIVCLPIIALIVFNRIWRFGDQWAPLVASDLLLFLPFVFGAGLLRVLMFKGTINWSTFSEDFSRIPVQRLLRAKAWTELQIKHPRQISPH